MIKDSIKTRFEKMIKYCDELIKKCENRTKEDIYNLEEIPDFKDKLIDILSKDSTEGFS